MDCDCVEVASLAELPPPAIVVLGERHAHKRDLKMARKAIDELAGVAPVTVAIEAVHGSKQEAMRQLGAGALRVGQLPAATDWSSTWGHDFAPYKTVFRSEAEAFVAAGLTLGKPPEGRDVPVPAAYLEKLGPMATHHGMDPEVFVRSMAWRDLGIAEAAVRGWSGEGYLVILTGRGHVSEGLGVSWQLGQGLTERPAHDYLLGAEGCATGDQVLTR